MQNDHITTHENHFFYPPGGILIWMIIVVEVITFGLALTAMAASSASEPELFHQSQQQLNLNMGAANTILLLLSGYLLAVAVQSVRKGDTAKGQKLITGSIVAGLLFVLIKSLEYSAKIDSGLTIYQNTFYTYYWLLTGFHLIHVITGLVILVVQRHLLVRSEGKLKIVDLEAGAAFWHMCDLIWLMIFPVIYLMF